MKLQRSPGPKRIASSISAAVATPSLTSHRASRHSASISRSATNPSISFERISGCMPTLRYISAACCLVASDVCAPPHTSTSGMRYTGLNGWPTTSRSGLHHVALHLGGQQARRRRAEHHVGPGDAAGRGEQLLLQLQPLGCALLHEVGAVDGLLDGRDDPQRALRRPRRSCQLGIGAAGVGQHLADLARRLGIGVEHHHVVAVEQEAGGPAAADHASAEQADVARRSSQSPVTSVGGREAGPV